MSIATWVGYPASYTAGRARAIQGVCVHYTAGSEGPTSAENGAANDKRRTDGTSTHVFADSDTVACEVPDRDRAHAARFRGNEVFLQLELCGTAQTRAQWLDPVSLATLRNGAKWTAEKCAAYGIPVRRLTVAQTRAAYYAAPGSRPLGIVGHVDITAAYPEDNGTHTDPGAEFPWDLFLGMVGDELAALNGVTQPKDDDMTQAQFDAVVALLTDIRNAVVDVPRGMWRLDAATKGDDTVANGPGRGEPVWLVTAVKAIHDAVTAPGAPGPATLVPHTHPVSVSVSGSGSGSTSAAVPTPTL